jgi:hypothetical protein
MLSSGSGGQFCIPQVVLLWRWLFSVLFYWGFVSLPRSLSLGQCQWPINCSPAVSVLWWFAVCFSICGAVWLWVLLSGPGDEFCDLLPACFREWLITHLLLAFLPFQCLFTDSSCRDYLLDPTRYSGTVSVIPPLLLCARLQLAVYCSVFFGGWCWGQSALGAVLVYLGGGWENSVWLFALTHLVCWMSCRQV